jgi:hypothetical protein
LNNDLRSILFVRGGVKRRGERLIAIAQTAQGRCTVGGLRPSPFSCFISIDDIELHLCTFSCPRPAVEGVTFSAILEEMRRDLAAVRRPVLDDHGGQGENGKLANVVLVSMNDADQRRFKTLMQDAVLKGWVRRAGALAAQEWNETVGKALGMEALP